MKSKQRKKNPLKTTWEIFCTISGILSFSHMAEDWFEDLIRWKGFIASIINSYQAVVHPVHEFVFGWIPWSIPFWITDYLILGILYATSLRKGIKFPEDDSPSFKEKYLHRDIWKLVLFESCLELYTVLCWPYLIIMHVWEYIEERPTDFRDSFLWFGAILLGFIALLSVNNILIKA